VRLKRIFSSKTGHQREINKLNVPVADTYMLDWIYINTATQLMYLQYARQYRTLLTFMISQIRSLNQLFDHVEEIGSETLNGHIESSYASWVQELSVPGDAFVQTHFLTAGNNLLAVASKWPGPFVS
jgi:hypothetical protein